METLKQAIKRYSGSQSQALLKYMGKAGIEDWADLTLLNLNGFRDILKESVSPGSAKTYAATFVAVLRRYRDEGILPCRDIDIVTRIAQDKPIKVALTEEELKLFEAITPTTENERYVQACFCVGARTGMRHSDIIRTDLTNIEDGLLTYSSKKTHIIATIPVSNRTMDKIRYIQTLNRDLTLMSYNRLVRTLAERAGITDRVKMHRGGKDLVRRKCDCLSSHSARVTFCTILAGKGVPVNDISVLAGHTNPMQTAGYIVRSTPKLNGDAMKFFNI